MSKKEKPQISWSWLPVDTNLFTYWFLTQISLKTCCPYILTSYSSLNHCHLAVSPPSPCLLSRKSLSDVLEDKASGYLAALLLLDRGASIDQIYVSFKFSLPLASRSPFISPAKATLSIADVGFKFGSHLFLLLISSLNSSTHNSQIMSLAQTHIPTVSWRLTFPHLKCIFFFFFCRAGREGEREGSKH